MHTPVGFFKFRVMCYLRNVSKSPQSLKKMKRQEKDRSPRCYKYILLAELNSLDKRKHLNHLKVKKKKNLKRKKKTTCCCFFGSATVKNGAQVCLNPDLPEVKELIKEWEKQVGEKGKKIFFLLEINFGSQRIMECL